MEEPRRVDANADVHNFASTSSPSQQHRLPTISGIEALRNATVKAQGIRTSLPSLDPTLLLAGFSTATPGVQRGYVTEVYGPPGVGKTTFGLQVAVNALCSSNDESHVLWVDTGSPLVEERLLELMKGYHHPAAPPPASKNAASPSASPPGPDSLDCVGSLLEAKFSRVEVLALPRLLTLFLHPTRSFLSPKTCLIVVDDLSNLLLGSFSRNPKVLSHAASAAPPTAVREKLERRAVGRRFRIIEALAAAMSKMAALSNVAVLVLTNAAVSLRSGQRAMLKPALSSQAWDTAVHTRIMLYRDFPDDEQQAEILGLGGAGLRYADVQRLARGDFFHTRPVPLTILTDGLRELGQQQPESNEPPQEGPHNDDDHDDHEPNEAGQLLPPGNHDDLPLLPDELSQPSQFKKRKAVEIADSEDDEDELHPPEWDEPDLPRPRPRGKEQEEAQGPENKDEMLLDAHEIAVLRSHRYASIRGSEDAIQFPSSDAEDDDHDSIAEAYQKYKSI
jgi:hypothetical protein